MALKVIGAGFGRTGTASLKEALEQLGFGPCHHMFEVNSASARQILALRKGESADFGPVLAGFQSAVDWPMSAFYKELMAAYPDAKVILTVRDPERWYDSARSTIYNSARIPSIGAFLKMVNAVVWDGIFGGRFSDKEHAIKVFNDHIEDVKSHVPADRLLVFKATDGWGPLCEFLAVPVPDTPFPNTNSRGSRTSGM